MTAPHLVRWLRVQGGIAHSSTVRAAGFRDHAVRTAISTGQVLRRRRSWLHLPDCDPQRIAAASVSGRVTCVSAAASLGLWTPPSDHLGDHMGDHAGDHVHVVVADTSSRLDARGLRLHYSAGPVPVARGAVHEPLLNVLYHVARCAARGDALAIWESALRQRLVEPAVLERVEWRSPQARELSEVAGMLSDSGLETHFVQLMKGAGVSVQQQVWVDGHPLDGLIGDRLAVQIDGFEHHRGPKDRRRDIAADARLTLLGYTVLRFDYHQVLFDQELVTRTILTAIAQGLHRRR